MNGAPAELIAAACLVVSLGFAIRRPLGLTEAVFAVPACALVVGLGIVPFHSAVGTVREIGPTIGFLAAILVFGHLCAEAGVFRYLGARAAIASRANPRKLLALVVAIAATITATLTLDATVVLVTPVVLATVVRLQVRPRPHIYACARLANSGSLLFPVSNLTNLLAFRASGLSFGRFTALMALPWLLVSATEWLSLRTFFRRDLASPERPAPEVAQPAPRYALGVLIATVIAFVVTSSLHVAPAWAALAGCIALIGPRVRDRSISARRLLAEASPGFCMFVAALAVIVDGVTRHGLGDGLRHLLPSGASFGALLTLSVVAAVLANIVNNIPATLALVPLVAAQPAGVLAVLLGVNIGPNATYPGSLATLLWRRQLGAEHKPRARDFHALGLITVPVLLVVAAAALWCGITVIGT